MKNTTKTLRDNLFKQMKQLQDGELCIKEAKIIARMSASIIHTVQAELDNKKLEIKLAKTQPRPKSNIDGKC